MHTMTEPRLAMSRIPGIELLRVLATVSIFLFHLWSAIPLSSDAWILGPVLVRLPLLGTLGVIVFNCISHDHSQHHAVLRISAGVYASIGYLLQKTSEVGEIGCSQWTNRMLLRHRSTSVLMVDRGIPRHREGAMVRGREVADRVDLVARYP